MIALVASPYLAGLTVSVADRANARWWHLCPASRARWAITAAVVAVLAALGGAASQWTVAWPAYLMLALAGSVLAVVDVEHHRLPDRLIVCAAVALVGSSPWLWRSTHGGACWVGLRLRRRSCLWSSRRWC